jgi:hypothetical protein
MTQILHTERELAAGNVPSLQPLRRALQFDETSTPDELTKLSASVGTQLFNFMCAYRLIDVMALIEGKVGLQALSMDRSQACKEAVFDKRQWSSLTNWPKLLVDFKEKMKATSATPAPRTDEAVRHHQLRSLCRLIQYGKNLEIRFNVQLAAMQLSQIIADSREVSFKRCLSLEPHRDWLSIFNCRIPPTVRQI